MSSESESSESKLVQWCRRQIDVIGSILSNASNDKNDANLLHKRINSMGFKFNLFVQSFTKLCSTTSDDFIPVMQYLIPLATRVKNLIDTAKEIHKDDQNVVGHLNRAFTNFVINCERIAGDHFDTLFLDILKDNRPAFTNIPSNNPYIIHYI